MIRVQILGVLYVYIYLYGEGKVGRAIVALLLIFLFLLSLSLAFLWYTLLTRKRERERVVGGKDSITNILGHFSIDTQLERESKEKKNAHLFEESQLSCSTPLNDVLDIKPVIVRKDEKKKEKPR